MHGHFIYLFIYLSILFIYLFIYLFILLLAFIYLNIGERPHLCLPFSLADNIDKQFVTLMEFQKDFLER